MHIVLLRKELQAAYWFSVLLAMQAQSQSVQYRFKTKYIDS